MSQDRDPPEGGEPSEDSHPPEDVAGVPDADTVSGTPDTGPRANNVVYETSVDIDDLGPRQFTSRSFILEMVKDEVIRAAVALLLLALLAFVIYTAFDRAKTWEQTKELLDVILPAVTALLGSAVGFYFGTKSS